MLRNWLVQACRSLGVECRADFIAGGMRFPAYLPHFGGPQGMVIASLGRSRVDVRPIYLSLVNADVYRDAAPDRLKEALQDWGWFGPPEQCPAWYAGFRHDGPGNVPAPSS